MAITAQVARPKSVAITTPALTVTDLNDLTLSLDHESHKHYGNERYPLSNIGNDATKLTIKTTDAAAYSALYKGLICASVTAIWQSTDRSISDDNEASGKADKVTYTCTYMKVDEAIEQPSGADGAPVEYTITLIPHKAADGTNPTQTRTVAA